MLPSPPTGPPVDYDSHLRRLLDGLPVGAYTCDNHGLITYFNRKAVELWGREPQLNDPTDRFCGSHRLFSSDGTALKHDQCWMARALQSDTEYFGEEIIVERPDGKRVTVLAHANPIHDASGKLVGGVNCLVDIGDRILADESRALLASIVESSDDAIVSKTLDGTILSWNSGAERLFGYTAAEAVGQSINLIVPSDRREEEQDILRRLRHGERIEHYETFRRSKTGQLVEISLCISPIREARTGTIIGASKVARDIGERKRWAAAQVALQDELMEQLDDLERLQEMSVRLFSTRDLQPILEEILVTAATLADTDMGVLYLSDPARGTLVPGAQLGFDEKFLAEIERQPTGGVTGACHEEGRRIVVEDVMTDPRFEAMRPAALRAGIRAVHSTPLITRSGVRVGVLSTHYREPHRPTPREQHLADLCARQAVDFIESARLYGQLLDADRSKNEFLAVLAHELRNPLAPIRNATRILRLAPARSTASASALETIERQMSMMTRLIDDLLDLGRITGDKLELRRQPLEVAEILRVAVETSGPAIDERGLQLDIQGPPAETVVFGDMTRLSQVISNLLDNASKFTAAGGRIWLTARREGDEAIITVKDNGIGIAAEALADIFEMFAQANSGHTSEHRGLGIGLSLVRRLVALHGGSVRVSSEGPAKGSVFEVRLPLFHPSSVESVEPDADPQSLAETTTRRVLVVEDNQDSASTMKTLLGLMGHTVMTAHDGVAALAAAQEFRPDVILLDIGIPLLNGLEVAKRIRTEIWGKDVILIATTGWSTKQDMERSRQEGFDHHLVKPVDLDLLQNLIQSPRATRAATDDSQAPIQTA